MNKRDLHLVVVSKPRREIVIPQQFGRFNAQDLAKVREVFVKGGYDPLGNTPEEARAFLAAEIKLYGDIVKKIGLTPE